MTTINFDMPASSFDYWHTNDTGVPNNDLFLVKLNPPQKDEPVETDNEIEFSDAPWEKW